jgi:Flp pilus assembly protein TadG
MRQGGFLCDARGAAAAEFALVLPLLAYIFLNVADLSMYLWSKMQVDLAAQSAVGAARYTCDGTTATKALPATVGANCSGYAAAMLSAAQTTSLGANVTLGTATEGWYCTTSAGALTLVAAKTATPPTDCSATLAGSKVAPGDYISTTASLAFASMFPGATIAAALPSTITSTAWMRLK